MKQMTAWIAIIGTILASSAQGEETGDWEAYLDYAYIYSSAEPEQLRSRLASYARETGSTLGDFISEQIETRPPSSHRGEAETRRESIAHLLQYIATGDPISLQKSVRAINGLRQRLERHENQYWYYYIHAHRALQEGDARDFADRILTMWREVVVPLETPYETYRTLSIDNSSASGFVSALPYIYENIARIVLIRSQQMGIDRGFDSLAAVIRFLHEGRIGSYPEIIPEEASSRDYLEAIVSRLEGPESDGSSLTFTLALFEATRYHDKARALLASEGLSETALDSIRVAVGSYQKALDRARTLQGQCAVYTRALRQLGELYATKQRLDLDSEIEIPFSIEEAIRIYSELHAAQNEEWAHHGYRIEDRDKYLDALHGLWEEIQEASFNAAAYYLVRGVQDSDAERVGQAVSSYSRYISLFRRLAQDGAADVIPDSAYFAAYVAARGIGDAILRFERGNPSMRQLQSATEQYLGALAIFPFDRTVWRSLAVALERQGRESEYLPLTRTISENVVGSRALNAWIASGGDASEDVDTLRRALSDDLAVMYLGFSDPDSIAELEVGLDDLNGRRSELDQKVASLTERRDALERERTAELAAGVTKLPSVSAGQSAESEGLEIARINTRITELDAARARLDEQIAARSRSIPLFRDVIESSTLTKELAAQRKHPLHNLVRRLYFESWTAPADQAGL